LAEGFPAISFAYPFGSFDSGTELVVHDCGYNSGRGVSGISKLAPDPVDQQPGSGHCDRHHGYTPPRAEQ
jgi:hypothetical protein